MDEPKHGHDSKEYKDYLKSDRWKVLVNKIKKRDKVCQGCGWIAYLDVHHKTYAHFTREFEEELVLVCRACHDAIHRKHNKYKDKYKHPLSRVTDEVLQVRKAKKSGEYKRLVATAETKPTIIRGKKQAATVRALPDKISKPPKSYLGNYSIHR